MSHSHHIRMNSSHIWLQSSGSQDAPSASSTPWPRWSRGLVDACCLLSLGCVGMSQELSKCPGHVSQEDGKAASDSHRGRRGVVAPLVLLLDSASSLRSEGNRFLPSLPPVFRKFSLHLLLISFPTPPICFEAGLVACPICIMDELEQPTVEGIGTTN